MTDSFYARVNSWYDRGYRPVVTNGDAEYMPPFRKALKAAGITYHNVTSAGKEEIAKAREITASLPRDWWQATHPA